MLQPVSLVSGTSFSYQPGSAKDIRRRGQDSGSGSVPSVTAQMGQMTRGVSLRTMSIQYNNTILKLLSVH